MSDSAEKAFTFLVYVPRPEGSGDDRDVYLVKNEELVEVLKNADPRCVALLSDGRSANPCRYRLAGYGNSPSMQLASFASPSSTGQCWMSGFSLAAA